MAEFIEKACKLCQICSRMKLSARGNLIRRMNSVPTPTSLILSESTGKENSFLLPRSPVHMRAPFEDQDTNSQDSGCVDDGTTDIRFAIPSGFAPKRSIDPSPSKSWGGEDSSSPSGPRRIITSKSSFRSTSLRSLSFCSTDSFDDGFSELADLDKMDENAPIALGSLLTGPLINGKEKGAVDENDDASSPTNYRPPVRRAFSMVDNHNSTPTSSGEGKLAYKRPRELTVACGLLKRRRGSGLTDSPRHKLQRSASESAATMSSSTLNNLYGRPDLIADFSRPYALPVVPGKHTDLVSITTETLAAVMRGEYFSSVRSYTIIDCRYPYEFEGGHIRGALNLYTCDQVESELLKGATPPSTEVSGDPAGRDILIFHCEFSQARGPSMYRWLRRLDRHASNYPSLQYPEVYLLHGGYQNFYNAHEPLCEPSGYRPMQDPAYEADLRKFRARSSSWSVSRANFKRRHLL